MLRILALLNNAAIELDGIEYCRAAEAFSLGRFREALGNVFSPGYPFFIALLHPMVPDLELAGRLVSFIFGTLLIWFSFFFGKRVLHNDRAGVGLAALVALHPSLVAYSGRVLSESLTTFLFTVAVCSFYVGWQEKRRDAVALSGFCLVFAYLTRPEYLIFYAPLAAILLRRRRVFDTAILLLPLLALGSLYILYLHAHTGMWLISNKATLSPFVPFSTFFVNIPLVSLHLAMAVSPLFFAFAMIGFGKTCAPYRNFALLLVIFHILSLAFISHTTKRYSVELVPTCLMFAVVGAGLLVDYLARFFNRRLVYQIVVCTIVLTSILQAYTPRRFDRAMHKKAGLFLLSRDPGSTIASRLPLVAFYAKGRNVNLLSELPGKTTPAEFEQMLTERRVQYLVLDEDLEGEFAFVSRYVSKRSPVFALHYEGSFVRVYRISGT